MKQLQFKIKQHGGKRRGAGRKNLSRTVSHGKRPQMDPRKPVHITMRLKKGLSGLRSPRLLREFQQSLGLAKAKGLRALHYSLLGNHLHFVAECADNEALAKGMNCFAARFGKIVRRRLGGKGRVFDGRYHVKVIHSGRQMRHTMAYVLLNESKHKQWEAEYDDYSSARFFKWWHALIGRRRARCLAEGRCDPLPEHLAKPTSWLARHGWRSAA